MALPHDLLRLCPDVRRLKHLRHSRQQVCFPPAVLLCELHPGVSSGFLLLHLPLPGSGDHSVSLPHLTLSSAGCRTGPVYSTGGYASSTSPLLICYDGFHLSPAFFPSLVHPSNPCWLLCSRNCCFKNLLCPAAQTLKVGVSCLHHAAKAEFSLH